VCLSKKKYHFGFGNRRLPRAQNSSTSSQAKSRINFSAANQVYSAKKIYDSPRPFANPFLNQVVKFRAESSWRRHHPPQVEIVGRSNRCLIDKLKVLKRHLFIQRDGAKRQGYPRPSRPCKTGRETPCRLNRLRRPNDEVVRRAQALRAPVLEGALKLHHDRWTPSRHASSLIADESANVSFGFLAYSSPIIHDVNLHVRSRILRIRSTVAFPSPLGSRHAHTSQSGKEVRLRPSVVSLHPISPYLSLSAQR